MSYEMKKRVIGLKNPTSQTRKENTDDVGVDQAPDLRFAFPQRFLGPFAFCYVCRSADELDELSVPIENRMTRGIDVPNCSVWQKNPVFGEGISSFAKRLLKSLLYPIAILGVDLLPKIVSRR
jgi:hypothetical protein